MYYASEPWYHDLYRNRDEIFEDGVHLCDIITRETLSFIDANAGKPFLIYVAYNQPHYPMVAKAKFIEMYKHLPMPRRMVAAMVAMVDDSVGQVMARLKERGLTDKTFVFFASDNGAPNASKRGEGGGSNAPYREYKRSLFDGGDHGPGIVYWPGVVPAGQMRDQLVVGMDLFPTIAELIGAKLPEKRTLDGMSWMPLLKNGSLAGHDALFFEWAEQHAVRYGPWKLVINGLINMDVGRQNRPTPDSPDYTFLTDTLKDPGEKLNLATQNRELVEKLAKMHADWRESIHNDPTSSPAFDAPPPKNGDKKG